MITPLPEHSGIVGDTKPGVLADTFVRKGKRAKLLLHGSGLRTKANSPSLRGKPFGRECRNDAEAGG